MHYPQSLKVAVLVSIGMIVGCNNLTVTPEPLAVGVADPAKAADLIYLGGDIVTIDPMETINHNIKNLQRRHSKRISF